MKESDYYHFIKWSKDGSWKKMWTQLLLLNKATLDMPGSTLPCCSFLNDFIAFIIGVTLLAQFPFEEFSWMLWMRHFMAGFFLVFAFFKLLSIESFANSYRMYDIIAAKWKGWGIFIHSLN